MSRRRLHDYLNVMWSCQLRMKHYQRQFLDNAHTSGVDGPHNLRASNAPCARQWRRYETLFLYVKDRLVREAHS